VIERDAAREVVGDDSNGCVRLVLLSVPVGVDAHEALAADVVSVRVISAERDVVDFLECDSVVMDDDGAERVAEDDAMDDDGGERVAEDDATGIDSESDRVVEGVVYASNATNLIQPTDWWSATSSPHSPRDWLQNQRPKIGDKKVAVRPGPSASPTVPSPAMVRTLLLLRFNNRIRRLNRSEMMRHDSSELSTIPGWLWKVALDPIPSEKLATTSCPARCVTFASGTEMSTRRIDPLRDTYRIVPALFTHTPQQLLTNVTVDTFDVVNSILRKALLPLSAMYSTSPTSPR
jgi:hypothetical protein